MKAILLFLLFSFLACSCHRIPEVTPKMASEFEVEESQLQLGRELYLKNCNRCHSRVFPGNLDAEYWREIVPHMAKNAELEEGDEQAILLYLMAAHNEVHNIH